MPPLRTAETWVPIWQPQGSDPTQVDPLLHLRHPDVRVGPRILYLTGRFRHAAPGRSGRLARWAASALSTPGARGAGLRQGRFSGGG